MMNMQEQGWSVWVALAFSCAAWLCSCETEDPRTAVEPGTVPATDGPTEGAEPRGLGQLCGNSTPDCAAGLTCYEGTCTPTPYAEACTPNPCGEGGVCNARGEVDDSGNVSAENLVLICRCPEPNQEWNGATCLQSASMEGFPEFSGSVLAEGETCPGPEEQPGVLGATDCPEGAFCDATASGNCLEYGLTLTGTLDGRDVDIAASGAEETSVECIRQYVDADGEESTAGVSAGVKLVVTGALAEAVTGTAQTLTIDVSQGDVLAGDRFLVLPQVDSPELRSDSVYATLITTDMELPAIGGHFTLDSVSGPDEDGDERVDDDEGALGGSFFLGFPNDGFLAGAFVVPCGINESVPAP